MLERTKQDACTPGTNRRSDGNPGNGADSRRDLERTLQQIRDYEHAVQDSADPQEQSFRALQAGMMPVSAAMEQMLVKAMSVQNPVTPEQMDKTRLSVSTYVGLNKQVQQFTNFLERSQVTRRARQGGARPAPPADASEPPAETSGSEDSSD